MNVKIEVLHRKFKLWWSKNNNFHRKEKWWTTIRIEIFDDEFN